MPAVSDAVMLHDRPSRAIGPLDAGDIGLFKDEFICALAMVVCKPDIQVDLHGCHTHRGIAAIGGELIGLPVNCTSSASPVGPKCPMPAFHEGGLSTPWGKTRMNPALSASAPILVC